ncbi:PAS domain S-box protein [Sorangium cellulosum]|uniref:Anti-anti-sigma factor n=1 Tax=Sorangium cellulosum TaxID=56 RepID=A0A150QLH0_SORCE|nr:PAS domain S-box protein [Sorangium cellulosum]KYF68819.1 anti-anti-sigma factor [Sorangium cellulosum]
MTVSTASPEGVEADAGKRALLLQRAPLAILEFGSDLTVQDWNGAAERLFGRARREALGRRVDELLPVSGDPGAWRRLLEEDGPAPRVWRHVTKDGAEVSFEWLHERLVDERGNVSGVGVFGQDVTERTEQVRRYQQKELILRTVTQTLPIVVWAIDREGIFTFHEGKGVEGAGLRQGELIGKNVFAYYADSDGRADLERALAGEETHSVNTTHGVSWENWEIPICDERGEVDAVVGFTLDISQAKNTEQELRSKLELIERQQQVIRDLSTPIIQVWEGVLTLPMIGVVDSQRTAEIMDTLLDAIVRMGARYAILDLTGVEMVDTKTASYLLDLVRAIRLLGAEGIVTGIRSNVAQTIVSLGLDLSSITTLGNLRAALQHCIRQMAKERAAAGAQQAAPAPR